MRPHRLIRGSASALLAAGLVASVGGGGVAAAGAADQRDRNGPAGVAAEPAEATATETVTRVTLPTGDLVSLRPDGSLRTVTAAPGREDIGFLTWTADDRVHVVPRDAVALLAADRLDPRLFDVTLLTEFGYHDAGSDTLPLLVAHPDADAPTVLSGDAAVTGVRELSSIGGSAISIDKAAAADFWSEVAPVAADAEDPAPETLAGGLDRIWLDGKRRTMLDTSVPQINAPEAWEAGYTGAGVRVAVLDGGIDAGHPDLAGTVVDARNFTEAPDGDQDGHGTHVASTIAGSGAASDGRYRGVAPDADLLDGKICEDFWCEESAILAGMEWAAADAEADVVNMSLGGEATPEIDPLEEAVDTLTAETGVLFVIAAGNDGLPGSVNSPGTADAALTVGSVDKDDELSYFSSRGPRIGDSGLKPDITAPGEEITAAASTDAGFDDDYITASGTSMATPHVVGAAAILAQARPDAGASELKSALMGSADPHPDLTVYEQGAGRVDVARSLRQQVHTEPASLSMGRQEWPHDDDEPVTRTLTYHNSGTEDVALGLEAGLTGPDGEPAPEGAISLDRERIELPAGGSAEVTVTADTTHQGPDGHYTGTVVATPEPSDGGDDSGTSIGTAVAIDKEVESYDLTLSHLDREGKAPDSYADFVFGLDEYSELIRFGGPDESEYTTRLPKGRYLVVSWVDTMPADEEGDWVTSSLAHPGFVHDREQTIELDARVAEPFDVEIPRDDLPNIFGGLDLTVTAEAGSFGFGVLANSLDTVFSAQLGPAPPDVDLDGGVTGFWGVEPDWDDPEGPVFPNEHEAYGVHVPAIDAVPTGFERRFDESEFATVVSRYNAQAEGSVGTAVQFGRHESASSASAVGFMLELPGRMTWSLSTDPGVIWSEDFDEQVQLENGEWDWSIWLWDSNRSYEPGRTYRSRWNQAPFGAGFADPSGQIDFPGAAREGDQMWSAVQLATDQQRHTGWAQDYIDATARLYADGELIVSEPEVSVFAEVPGEETEYRVEVEAERAGHTPFSVWQQAAWTFRSSTTDEVEPLPMWSVRFQPKVDRMNTVTAGPVHLLPIELQAQPGSDVGRVQRLRVEVSGDGGDHWRRVPVALFPSGKAMAVVDTRRGGEFVSLRAEATDTDGNKVEQTIIDAYRVG